MFHTASLFLKMASYLLLIFFLSFLNFNNINQIYNLTGLSQRAHYMCQSRPSASEEEKEEQQQQQPSLIPHIPHGK